MGLKQQIDTDLKTAMLAGDKTLVTTLRGLKSVILYEEVAQNVREAGLPDDEITKLLAKEAKKRQESADLYAQGGDKERQNAELEEKSIIEKYLPKQLSETEINKLIDEAITKTGNNQQNMGQIIGQVKQAAGAGADGAVIARLVKERVETKRLSWLGVS